MFAGRNYHWTEYSTDKPVPVQRRTDNVAADNEAGGACPMFVGSHHSTSDFSAVELLLRLLFPRLQTQTNVLV